MSERGQFRGGRGGDRGGRGGRGGGNRGGRGGGNNDQGERERPKKENILDLNKYMDKEITVKFSGGREGTIELLLFISNESCDGDSRVSLWRAPTQFFLFVNDH